MTKTGRGSWPVHAISRRIPIDHGAVQPLEILFGDIAARRVVPVFVNGVAAPFTPMRRIRRMGTAVGEFVATLSGERVLLIGSGGLSHDPPVPRWETATDRQRADLLDGRDLSPDAREARRRRVIETARAFAAGEAGIRDLNLEWDAAFLDICASGDLEEVDGWSPARMAEDAGNSAHEVRTWLAAFSALRACGGYGVVQRFYRPIPELIAGFGLMTAR